MIDTNSEEYQRAKRRAFYLFSLEFEALEWRRFGNETAALACEVAAKDEEKIQSYVESVEL